MYSNFLAVFPCLVFLLFSTRRRSRLIKAQRMRRRIYWCSLPVSILFYCSKSLSAHYLPIIPFKTDREQVRLYGEVYTRRTQRKAFTPGHVLTSNVPIISCGKVRQSTEVSLTGSLVTATLSRRHTGVYQIITVTLFSMHTLHWGSAFRKVQHFQCCV